MDFAYHWLHIPTGTKGSRTVEFLNEKDCLEKMDRWNGQNPGVWQYWRA